MSHRQVLLILKCLCLVILALFLSCANRKLGSSDPVNRTEASTLVTALEKHQLEYEWFSGKARIKLITEDLQVGATIRLRMIKDSIIWARIDKLGFEMGRALITPDSAYVIDRIHKEYYIEHLSTFLDRYHVPFTFEDLQRVLAGGTLNGYSDHMQVTREENRYGLSMLTDDFNAQYWFDRLLHLEQGIFTDDEDRVVQLSYADYRDLDLDHPMPFKRYLELDDGENMARISLLFARIEVNVPKSVPFEIPGHYAKVD